MVDTVVWDNVALGMEWVAVSLVVVAYGVLTDLTQPQGTSVYWVSSLAFECVL